MFKYQNIVNGCVYPAKFALHCCNFEFNSFRSGIIIEKIIYICYENNDKN